MAMNNQLLTIVQHYESERGVSREIVLTAIEQAINQAARRNRDVTNGVRVSIDRTDFSIHVFDTLVCSTETGHGLISPQLAMRFNKGVPVPVGQAIEIEYPASRLGRIAAQMSRQVIIQKIREAERTNTFSEYKDRIGDIVTGTVTTVTHKETYVTVGRVEMVLPHRECIPTESFQVGDTVRAIVLRVDPEAKGPSVVLSRTSGKFLEALFRLEVSEVADGIVEIMGVARDPGYRAKIAVRTANENIDPVGACVGQRGSRVKVIVNELCGEKIDVVRWNEDIRQYIAQALAPAKLESIEVDPDPRSPNTIHVLAAADQYSLAIGKHGQNARLTTRLTGWKLDVKKSLATASFEDQKAAAIRELADTISISNSIATQIADAGYLTVDGIAEEDEASFIAATGLDEVSAKGIYAAAKAVQALTSGAAATEAE